MPSIDSKTPADIFQTIAWAALTAVILGYAIADGSIGALILGAVTLVQTWHAWTSAADRSDAESQRFAPQQL
jgi:hypothetical protein